MYHSYIDSKWFEEYEYLGVYPSKELTSVKIEKLKEKKAIYKKFPNGFDISEEVLDSDNVICEEGFSKWD